MFFEKKIIEFLDNFFLFLVLGFKTTLQQRSKNVFKQFITPELTK